MSHKPLAIISLLLSLPLALFAESPNDTSVDFINSRAKEKRQPLWDYEHDRAGKFHRGEGHDSKRDWQRHHGKGDV